ncbi:EpsG family protein [Nostoc sphaeroides]|uniref:EpsG family protein n=1 Tax=Nostoc sphaeroides CCNUC1 TaxID=2653204 RepID=A0A5P8VSS7_9NOSO|nr:EpsG family protein [Nostoc sphaeroides]QFS43256.1 hypothetical protein GXM_00729 [Nostoc sphaeroides CCNUC1]
MISNAFSKPRSSYLKTVFLLLALAIWMVVPIIGIFPLLIYVELNYKNKIINHFLLAIVVITLSVFNSSIYIHSDTENYLTAYEECGITSWLSCLENAKFEPFFYILSYPVFYFSNGSRIAFLIFWSLLINTLTIFIICKAFSKKHAALLIIIVLLNPTFYTQNFLMRQFMANTLFLSAITLRKNKLLFIIFILLSILTHYSVLIYLPLIFINFSYLNNKYLKKKKYIKTIKNIIYISSIFCLFLVSFLFKFNIQNIEYVVSFFNEPIFDFVTKKSDYFFNKSLVSQTFNIQLVYILLIGISYIITLYKKASVHELEKNIVLVEDKTHRTMIYLYILQASIFIITIDLDYLPLRLSLMLIAYSGIFFYPLFENNLKLRYQAKLFIGFIIAFLAGYFIYYLYNIQLGNNIFNFLEGEVFTSSLVDYIEFILNKW